LLAIAAVVTGIVGPFGSGASSSASQPGFVSVGVGSLSNGCGIGQTANHFYSTSPGGATLARACGATVHAALQSVEFDGRSTLVTTGDNGQIQTSTDGGVTWTARPSPTIKQLMSVAHNGTSWLAVGASNTTLWSPDGFTWTARATCCGNIWNAVAGNGAGTWVRVGGGGKLATSTDNGVSWTARDSKVIVGLNSVSWDGRVFIAAGDNGQITRSVDGTTWTNVTPAPGFGIGIWEVRGNGSTWIAVGPPAVTPNTANVLRSTDGGSTWTRVTTGLATPGETLYSVGFDPASTSWMAVGLGGVAGAIWRSTDDGLTWSRVAPPNAAAQYSVIHGLGAPMSTTTTTEAPTTTTTEVQTTTITPPT
jgi:photosystem II stability/assembly factor-like uncharacterized protein